MSDLLSERSLLNQTIIGLLISCINCSDIVVYNLRDGLKQIKVHGILQ